MSSIAAYFASKICGHFENWMRSQDSSNVAAVYPGRLLLRAFEGKLIEEILSQLETRGIEFQEPNSESGFILAIQDHSSYENLSYKKISIDGLVRERNRDGNFFSLLIVPETIPTLEQVTRLDQHKINDLNEVRDWINIAAKMSSDDSMFLETDMQSLAQFVYYIMESGWDKKPVIPLKAMSLFVESVIEDTKKNGLFWSALGKNCTVLGGINRGRIFDELKKENNPSKFRTVLRRIINKTLSADIDFWQGVLNSRQIEFSVIEENIEKIQKQDAEYKDFCEKTKRYFELFFNNNRDEFEKFKAEIQLKFDAFYPFERVLRAKRTTQKVKLGERTRIHFEFEDMPLLERELEWLSALDSASLTEVSETDLLQFYDKNRKTISRDAKLDQTWLNKISKDKEIVCSDLVEGIHLALGKHVFHGRLDECKHVRLRLLKARTRKTLGAKNKEALEFFFKEYSDLETFWHAFGDNFYTDFPTFFTPDFLDLDDSGLRSGRSGRDPNALSFQISLIALEKEGDEKPTETVLQHWNILWRFEPLSFANVKYEDLSIIAEHKELFFDSNYKIEIESSKLKLVDSLPSVNDRSIFVKLTQRSKNGRILDKKSTPANQKPFTSRLSKLVGDSLISVDKHEELIQSFKKLESHWRQAILDIQKTPMTCELNGFTDSYLLYLDELIELNKNERIDADFQELVYEFINLQSTYVAKAQNYLILPPWHPFSLIFKSQRNRIHAVISSDFKNKVFKIGNRVELGAFDEAYLSLIHSIGKGLLIKKVEGSAQDLICTNSVFGYHEYSRIVDSKNTLSTSEIKKVVSSTTNNFLEIFPHQKQHLMLLFEGLQSFEQVAAAYTSLLDISSDSDDEISITAVFTSEDTVFLENIYERFCDSLDDEKVDPSIKILIKDYDEKFQNEEVDIIFSFDPLFRGNKVSDTPDKFFIDSDLKSFWEMTNTRKVPTVLSSDNPSFSLNSHIQGEEIAVLHRAVMKSAGRNPETSFYREVSGNTLADVLPSYLKNTNWLTIYDFLINKDVLNRSAKDQSFILRFVQGTGDKRSLGLLTQKDTTHLTKHLKNKLLECELASNNTVDDLSESVFFKANSFNSDILLRATGDSNISYDIIGTTVGSGVLEEYFNSLNQTCLFDIFWIHLDDYMHWFKASDYDGDRFKALGTAANYVSDLLGITITELNGFYTLHLVVCESKLTKSNTDNLQEKSAKQLQTTIKLLKNMLSDRNTFDYYFWLNKFFEFIVVNAKFNHSTFSFEDLLKIDKANIEINLYGISLVFKYGNDNETSQGIKLFKDEEGYLYQIRLCFSDTKKALMSLYKKHESDRENILDKLVKIEPEKLNENARNSEITALKSIPQFQIELQSHEKTSNPVDASNPLDSEKSQEPAEPTQQLTGTESQIVENTNSLADGSFVSSIIEFMRQEVDAEEGESINLDAVKAGVREIFSHSNLPSQFVEHVVTPNSILVKLKGDLKYSIKAILTLKDSFLSVAGLSLRQAYADKGLIVLVFDRDKRQTVHFADLLERSFAKRQKTINKGYNHAIILGQNEYEDTLCYFRLDGPSPHALIGGQTKSGKSVLLNSMIADLMITNHPKHLRLWLFDPKQVEFAIYSRSPHLAHPVIFEKETAINCLKEIEQLMNERYLKLRELGLRDIESYNKRYQKEPLSREVIFFDEVADWFLDDDFKGEAKDIVSRLSSKGRAAGIHLILATQRPSNDVVTPILRANLDTKIALKVDRELNSNIILGESGAENLLGYGHGIVKTEGQTIHIQVGFTDSYLFDEVVDKIISYWNRRLET